MAQKHERVAFSEVMLIAAISTEKDDWEIPMSRVKKKVAD
jgi:hypothetical protein